MRMKAQIIITDEKGATFEGAVELSQTRAIRRGIRPKKAPKLTSSQELDFDMPMRAFVKTHGQKLSGPKKFVLLAAYLAKGQEGKEVQLKEIERHWNRTTSLMGGRFNRFYSNIAKENGWVNTRKAGIYILRQSWKAIFSG